MERKRRFLVVVVMLLLFGGAAVYDNLRAKADPAPVATPAPTTTQTTPTPDKRAIEALGALAIKGRAPRTGYARSQFGDGWEKLGGCDVRNHILKRDMTEVIVTSEADCTVLKGILEDPYTAKIIMFSRGPTTSDDVQIDHVVALSDAWQKGGQQLTPAMRQLFANDPLNLLAVDGPANQNKGDGDAATWLPPNKSYRCRYVARQIAVKIKYTLWVTLAEQEAMKRVLDACPEQRLPIVGL